MLKCLYPEVDWNAVDTIGFDMDGTLYDEAEFISQAYQPISEHFARLVQYDADYVHHHLYTQWLCRGSSYNKIFEDFLSVHTGNSEVVSSGVGEAISLFRKCTPALSLPGRTRTILTEIGAEPMLFLVTDGNAEMQKRKADALSLDRWIPRENWVFTALSGPHAHKPAINSLWNNTHLAERLGDRSRIVFFGDRVVDRDFAANIGAQFVLVKNMVPQMKRFNP
jgi:phosphoglycolate phosphatase-like HAD superfamily hydrolase